MLRIHQLVRVTGERRCHTKVLGDRKLERLHAETGVSLVGLERSTGNSGTAAVEEMSPACQEACSTLHLLEVVLTEADLDRGGARLQAVYIRPGATPAVTAPSNKAHHSYAFCSNSHPYRASLLSLLATAAKRLFMSDTVLARPLKGEKLKSMIVMIQAMAAESQGWPSKSGVAERASLHLGQNRGKQKSPKFMAAQTSQKCGVNLDQQHKTLDVQRGKQSNVFLRASLHTEQVRKEATDCHKWLLQA